MPRRISIIGSTGSGKTHLARMIAERLGLPHIELDSIRKEADGAPFPVKVQEMVASDSWIIDGHYRDVRHLVWQRADLVVFLDYPLHLIARQLLKRYFSNSRGSKKRKSGQASHSASWGRRFSRVVKTLNERREYARVLTSPEFADVKVRRFKSHKAAFEWVQTLGL